MTQMCLHTELLLNSYSGKAMALNKFLGYGTDLLLVTTGVTMQLDTLPYFKS